MTEAEREMRDLTESLQMVAILDKYYPGHLWAVHVQSKQGIAQVRNFYLDGHWGFLLHLGKDYSASHMEKRLMLAGGELLERYRLSRARFNESQYLAQPTDFAGRMIADRG